MKVGRKLMFLAAIVGIASISPFGLAGCSRGDAVIIDSGKIDSGKKVATGPSLIAVDLSPQNSDMNVGTSLRLTATGTYSDGTTADISSLVSWKSSTCGVAAIDSTGLIVAVSFGNTVVTASSGTIAGSTGISVIPVPGYINIALTAQVDSVDDAGGYLGGAVAPGDIITGAYVYGSAAVDSSSSSSIGHYRYTATPAGITLGMDGLVFRTDPATVDFVLEITNDYNGRDTYLLRSYKNQFDRTVPSADNHISWQLDDTSDMALFSDALPLLPPVLANWQSVAGLSIASRSIPESFTIKAHVTAVELVP